MKKIKREKLVNIISIALIVGAISFSSVTLARYVSKETSKTQITPTQFYFNLDKVEGETYELIVKESKQTTEATFNIYNYVFDSVTGVDISYSIKGYIVTTSGSNEELTNIDVVTEIPIDPSQKYILMAGGDGELTLPSGGDKKVRETITLSNMLPETKYKIVVTSSQPFIKECSFYYNVAKEGLESFYTITDNGSWIELDLYFGDKLITNDIIIDYGSDLTPNTSMNSMSDWSSDVDNKHVLLSSSINGNTHYKYQFIELNSGDYSRKDGLNKLEKLEIIDNEIKLVAKV